MEAGRRRRLEAAWEDEAVGDAVTSGCHSLVARCRDGEATRVDSVNHLLQRDAEMGLRWHTLALRVKGGGIGREEEK